MFPQVILAFQQRYRHVRHNSMQSMHRRDGFQSDIRWLEGCLRGYTRCRDRPPLFMDGGGGPHRDGSGKDTASKLLYTQNIVDDVDRNN